MTHTPTGYEQTAAANPARPGGKGAWVTPSNTYCVEAVWLCGGFSRSFANATTAADYVKTHHGLDPDWSTARPGEFDYWGTAAGHVAMRSISRPGFDLMVSDFAPATISKGFGYLPPNVYGIPSGHGHTYMGHSPFFGDETLATEIVPSQLRQSGDSMLALEFTDPPIAGWKFLLAPGYIKNAPLTQADEYALMTGQTIQSVNLAAMTDQLWNHGFAPLLPKGQTDVVAFLQSLTGGAFKVASWLTPTGTTSLQPVLDQLAAIDKLETSDQTALITAINALPAEVRAKIVAAP